MIKVYHSRLRLAYFFRIRLPNFSFSIVAFPARLANGFGSE